jgi:hypothetical protein
VPVDGVGIVRKYLRAALGSQGKERHERTATGIYTEPEGSEGRLRADNGELIYFALAAIFFTIASTSFRSLSFRFAE